MTILSPCRPFAIAMASSSYHSTTRMRHAPRMLVAFHADRPTRFHRGGEEGGGDWNRMSLSYSPRRRHNYHPRDRSLVAAKSFRSYGGSIVATARTTQLAEAGRRCDAAMDIARRWRSDGGVDLRGGGGKGKNDATTTTSDARKKMGDRRREDHAHCVEIVRTRDYEGYRECDENEWKGVDGE